MATKTILTSSPPTNKVELTPHDQAAAAWLESSISQQQAELAKLEAELKHRRIALRGHQIWLDLIRGGGCNDG